MRTDNRGVARAFALGKSAASHNGQLFTDGTTIWSYGPHWPIATRKGGELILNGERYGVTTSRHTTLVRSELSRALGYDKGLPRSVSLADIKAAVA